jgi:DNA primase
MKDGAENKRNKWRADKRQLGGRRLFNLPLLENWDADDPRPLIITESELDCMLLAGLGCAAVSVDGAGHRLLEPDLVLLKKVQNLILAFDADEAGAKCTSRFRADLPAARVLTWPGAKDACELRTLVGAVEFERRMNTFLGKIEEGKRHNEEKPKAQLHGTSETRFPLCPPDSRLRGTIPKRS